jgi:hypothetical protein
LVLYPETLLKFLLPLTLFGSLQGILCVICYLKARHQWLTPVILAIWKAEIGKIAVQGQPGQIVYENSISKITRAK